MNNELFKWFGSIGLKTDDAEKGMSGIIGKAEETGNKMLGSFKKAAVAIGAVFAVDKVIDFSKMALEASATSQALNSQFSQVFGDLEDEARAGMERVAQEVGSLPNRLLPAFNQISSFAKVNGMETSEALGFTERAMVAAADSAAWYDKSIEETTDTLQSYLKGNYEVADNLGILSTETTRNAAATKMFGDEYKNLSGLQQQEVLLAMYEEANQLSGAMGQAAREADGWENVMGNLKQSWQDFLAIVGAPILKAVIPIVQGITNWVVKLAKALKGGNPTLDAMKEIFVAIGEVLKDVFVETMEVLNELWAEFSELMESVDWDGIYNSIKDVIDKGLKLFEPILTAINRVIQAQIDYWKGLFNAIKQIFSGDWQGAWETLKTTFLTAIVRVADALYDGFIGMFDNVKELLGNIDWLGVGQSIMTALGNALTTGIAWLGDIGSSIKTWISEKLGLGTDGTWSEIGTKVLQNIGTAVDGAVETVKGIGETVGTWISDALGLDGDASWSEIGTKIVENIKAAIDTAVDAFGEIGETITTWIIDKLGLPEDTSWAEIGLTILQNIIDAASNAGAALGEFVTNLITGINNLMTAEQFMDFVRKFLSFIATSIAGATTALLAIAIAFVEGFVTAVAGQDSKFKEIATDIIDAIGKFINNSELDIDWYKVLRVPNWVRAWLNNETVPYMLDRDMYNGPTFQQKFEGDPENDRGTGGRESSGKKPQKTSWLTPKTASASEEFSGREFQSQTPTIDSSAVNKLIEEVQTKISSAIAKIEELGRNYTAKLIDGMVKGITTNQSKVTLNIGILGNNMKAELDKIHNKAVQAIDSGMDKVQVGYRSGLLKAYATVRDNLTRITEAFRSQIASVTKAGEDTGRGFYNGLASQQARIEGLARNIARSIDNTIRATLEIASPSKVGERTIGFYTGTIVDGLLNAVSEVKKATDQVAEAMLIDPKMAGLDLSYQAANAYGGHTVGSLDNISKKLEKLDWLEQLYFKDTNNYMDSREVSRVILEPLEEERRMLDILKKRQRGDF